MKIIFVTCWFCFVKSLTPTNLVQMYSQSVIFAGGKLLNIVSGVIRRFYIVLYNSVGHLVKRKYCSIGVQVTGIITGLSE